MQRVALCSCAGKQPAVILPTSQQVTDSATSEMVLNTFKSPCKSAVKQSC